MVQFRDPRAKEEYIASDSAVVIMVCILCSCVVTDICQEAISSINLIMLVVMPRSSIWPDPGLFLKKSPQIKEAITVYQKNHWYLFKWPCHMIGSKIIKIDWEIKIFKKNELFSALIFFTAGCQLEIHFYRLFWQYCFLSSGIYLWSSTFTLKYLISDGYLGSYVGITV